jgi:hypothetical protein
MIRVLHGARFLVAVAACLGVNSSCASVPTQPSRIVIGQPTELAHAQSVSLPDGSTLRFAGVKSDSRCPMDVMCVWAGDATIAISLTSPSGGAAERELHVQPSGSETSYQAYSIRLTALSPYPRSNLQIRPEDYRATFTVNQK